MMLVLCPKCRLTLRVMGDADEVDHLVGERSPFWPDRYPCPSCGGSAQGLREVDVATADLVPFQVRDLTAQEAFAALNGLGLPEEQVCTKAALEALLREQPVRHVGAEDILGSRRCYLFHLELWDGTKVYLGAGSGGAVVYRVARPHSYTEEVVRELDAG